MNPPASYTPINLDQHGFFFGTTGAGKSYRLRKQVKAREALLARRGIAMNLYKIIIIDTKPVGYGQDDALGHFSDMGGTIIRDWRDFDPNRIQTRIIVYRPRQEDIRPQTFEEFFGFLRGIQYTDRQGKLSQYPFLLAIDELTDVITADGKRVVYLQNLDKILRQGRESLQTIWIATQYPVFIDPSIKRLVTVRFLFRLPDPKDRRMMVGYFGSRLVDKPIRDRHGFWYQNDLIEPTTIEPRYYTGVNAA